MNNKILFFLVAVISCLIVRVVLVQAQEDVITDPDVLPKPIDQKILDGINDLKDKAEETSEEMKNDHLELSYQIEKIIPPPSKPTNSVSKTWVAIRLYNRQGSDRGDWGRPTFTLKEGSKLFILNPGLVAANVSCFFITDRGHLFERIDFTLEPFWVRQCSPTLDPGESRVTGWAVIDSDQWLLVDGADFGLGSYSKREGMMKLYPIDCDDPKGVESVCALALVSHP